MIEPNPPPHPAYLPWLIPEPGQTHVLMIVTGAFLVLFTMTIGVLFLRLHHLPEHIAQKGQKVQYEIVAVPGLLAMFTHENIL